MKPFHFVLFWTYSFITFLILLFLLYMFSPELFLFNWFTEKIRFIPEENWNEIYGYGSFAFCYFLNCIVVWLTVKIKITKKMKPEVRTKQRS